MRIAPAWFRRKSWLVVVFGLLAPAPAGTVATFAADLRVSWASGAESDLRGYRLRYGTAPGPWTETVDLGAGTSCTVSGLARDTTYSFAVLAYDHADNESRPSAELLARIPSGLAPMPQILGVSDTTTNSIYAARARIQVMRFSGRNLQPGASITLGPDVVVDPPAADGTGDLVAAVRVDAKAALGPRVATVVNPDQGTASASDLVQVVKSPDGNADCAVDVLDLNALARAWNEALGESRYVAEADLDGDDFVGPDDLTILVKFLGRSLLGCP
jgi:hypothetical protein